jgi:predicted dehydrogenase
VEKPIALDYHQTIELYQIAKKNRVLLFEGIKTGFSPAYIAMKKIIKQGIIGDLTFVHSTHAKVSTSGKIPNPQATDNVAGFHLAGGMYALFITLDLLDSPKTISFLNNSYPNNKAISTSVLNMRHSNNAISSVLGSDAFTDNLTSKICGTKGCIILGGNLKKYHKNYLRDSCHFAYTYSLYDNLGNFIKSEEIPVKTNGEGLCKEIDHVYELLKEHRLESNIVTPKISIMISKILSLTNKVDDTKVIKFL